MKILIIQLIALHFINSSFSQMDTLGAIKFSYNDSLLSEYPNEKLFITCISKKYNSSDTTELNSNGTTKSLLLIPGKYTISIGSNSFSNIKYRNIIVEKSIVTFIDLELIKRTKRDKTVRVKYKKPVSNYKNCG